MTPINVLFFGAPAAGKNTILLVLEKLYLTETHRVETGKLIRNEIASGSDYGKYLEGFTSKGQLVPDEDIFKLIKADLDNSKNARIRFFDGFPRTIPQWEFLWDLISNNSNNIGVKVEADEKRLMEHMVHRAQREGRKDDNLEAFKARLEVYKKEVVPTEERAKEELSKFVSFKTNVDLLTPEGEDFIVKFWNSKVFPLID